MTKDELQMTNRSVEHCSALGVQRLSPAERCSSLAFGIRRLAYTIACLLLLLLAFSVRAQDAAGPLVYTVGTTWRETPANRDWAYLLWLGSQPSLLNGQLFAVYAKPGDASSAALYERKAIVGVQTDTTVINSILQRASSIGEDLAKLETDINALFAKFMPAGATRAEKISAVIRGALLDEDHYAKIMLLARTHPAMAMALGVGHAELIEPGLTTFEIRQFNRATQQDIAVIGRVTVEANAPTALPPPGMPIHVPRAAPARGDMNVPIRWSTPDPLRRLGMLQHGYNVWRVRQDYAESPLRQWHVTPPTPAVIIASGMATGAVRRLNELPILSSKLFTDAEVANFTPPTGDSNTVFYTDADMRGLPGYIPTDFTNGARFYYFTSARDILGRDGLLSRGTNIMICDRLFPNALQRVEVVNDYVYNGGSPQHHLRVVWQQASNMVTDEETIKRYWVYRWTNVSEIQAKQANLSNNLIAVVNHLPLAYKNSYLDNGPGSPSSATDLTRTFWYTVRSEDSGACSGNLSPHSAPVSGALRDRVGPAGPTGRVDSRCVEPLVSIQNVKTNGGGTNVASQVRVYAKRVSQRVAWVDLRAEVRPPNETNVLADFATFRRHFAPDSDQSDWILNVPNSFDNQTLWVFARCGLVDGQVSAWCPRSQVLNLKRTEFVEMDAVALVQDNKRGDCGDVHYPVNPGDGTIVPIDIVVIPTPTSRELRIYRRVDDGPLTLVCQKAWSNTIPATVVCQDDSFPAVSSTICYYAQLFDEHSNPSPLVRLKCIRVIGPADLPRPMLSPIDAYGNDASPGMYLRWFCAPAGVERFEVGIAGIGENLGDNPANNLLAPLPGDDANQYQQVPKTQPQSDNPLLKFLQLLDFRAYHTPHIGPGSSFGNGAQFELPVNIKLGVTYLVYVKAVGKDGSTGKRSNVESFKWEPPTNTLPDTVTWPPRPLPNVGNSFGIPFIASFETNLHNRFTGAVVRVGFFQTNVSFAGGGNPVVPPVGSSDFGARPQVLRGVPEPMAYLFSNSNGLPLFPLAMYRHQVPNAKFPTVSGDISQVSPMMESIAFQRAFSNSVVQAIIHDPFMVYDGYQITLGNAVLVQFTSYLRDTQPVVRGARYRYLLTRFRDNGEIAEVIPTNEMEVP